MPGVSRSTMTLEYRKAVEEQGVDYRTLKRMARNSIDYCFADAPTRRPSADRPGCGVPRVRNAPLGRAIGLGDMRAILTPCSDRSLALQARERPAAHAGRAAGHRARRPPIRCAPVQRRRSSSTTRRTSSISAPGIVRRAAAAAEKGISIASAREPAANRVRHAPALRSHTVGYPDLIFSTLGAGTPRAAAGVRSGRPRRHDEAHHAGVAGRHRHQDASGLEHRPRPGSTSRRTTSRRAWSTRTRTVQGHRVSATRTASGRRPSATASTPPTGSIVVSGDTNPSDALVRQCQKCDVLIHEAYSDAATGRRTWPNWLEYRSKYTRRRRSWPADCGENQPGPADHPPPRRRCRRPRDFRGAVHRRSASGAGAGASSSATTWTCAG